MQSNKGGGASRYKIYLAGPLFSEAERTYNKQLTQLLEECADVYLPQRDGGLMSEMVRDGVPPEIASKSVFMLDMDAISQADCLIAILDGRAIDEGVAFELGIAYSYGKCCIGLQTDSRRLAWWGNNPMISSALEKTFENIEELVSWVMSKATCRTPSLIYPLPVERVHERSCWKGPGKRVHLSKTSASK